LKRIAIAFIAVLLTAAAFPAFALDDRNATSSRATNVVDEVIRMWKSNVSEDEIVSYVHKVNTRFSVSADDIIDMSDAKVPRTVIKAVLDEADRRDDGRYTDRRSTVYVAPAPYYGYYGPAYYGPAYYDPFFYDPWFYGPRVSIGFGFGRVFRGGHFGHRR
jgi:hypothetical protein